MTRTKFGLVILVFTLFVLSVVISFAEEVNKAQNEVRFDFSNLTIMDEQTNLMWTNKAGMTDKVTWEGAMLFIKQLNKQKYAGYSNWRLPTKEELETLPNFAKGIGRGDEIKAFFTKIGLKNTQAFIYYASSAEHDKEIFGYSEGSDNTPFGSVIIMSNGYRYYYDKNEIFDVWPVRFVK